MVSSMVDRQASVDPNRLIHEPGRLAALVVLHAVEEADFLFLMDQTGLTKGNLSSHTAKLEAAGYVEIEKGFVGKVPRTIYRLTKTGATALQQYRDHMVGLLESIG